MGTALFRKPFLPLFKVYDIRRNLSDLTFLYSFYQNPPVFCGFFQIPSMRSVLMYSTGLFLIQFCIQLSFLSFCLPFFKLSLSFFRFKERLNGGQQCSCERVDLIIRYACGVLFLSRHFCPITFGVKVGVFYLAPRNAYPVLCKMSYKLALAGYCAFSFFNDFPQIFLPTCSAFQNDMRFFGCSFVLRFLPKIQF